MEAYGKVQKTQNAFVPFLEFNKIVSQVNKSQGNF